MKKKSLHLAAVAVVSLAATAAHAGPYILAGTDADDHGSATTTANLDGWLFMQKALENLASSSSLTTTNRVVYSLGSDTGSTAGDAAASAFKFSNLASKGWTFQAVGSLTQTNFTSALGSAGIIMFDSASNVTGGLSGTELSLLTANASAINSFVGGGGGLFSQANGYGWLSALVPTLSVYDSSYTGLTLTSSGTAAFPGLANADLSAGPYHEAFNNVGAIPVLALGQVRENVIIGSFGGSITNPDPVVPGIPEPSTYALMGLGLAGIGLLARRRRPD